MRSSGWTRATLAVSCAVSGRVGCCGAGHRRPTGGGASCGSRTAGARRSLRWRSVRAGISGRCWAACPVASRIASSGRCATSRGCSASGPKVVRLTHCERTGLGTWVGSSTATGCSTPGSTVGTSGSRRSSRASSPTLSTSTIPSGSGAGSRSATGRSSAASSSSRRARPSPSFGYCWSSLRLAGWDWEPGSSRSASGSPGTAGTRSSRSGQTASSTPPGASTRSRASSSSSKSGTAASAKTSSDRIGTCDLTTG